VAEDNNLLRRLHDTREERAGVIHEAVDLLGLWGKVGVWLAVWLGLHATDVDIAFAGHRRRWEDLDIGPSIMMNLGLHADERLGIQAILIRVAAGNGVGDGWGGERACPQPRGVDELRGAFLRGFPPCSEDWGRVDPPLEDVPRHLEVAEWREGGGHCGKVVDGGEITRGLGV
jgi:hypothetical protein